MSVPEQARAFAVMAFCGAVSAAVYDAAMLVRRAAHAGRFATGVLDAAFGVFLAALVTFAGLRLRIEPFRLYVLLGVLMGMLVWAATAGAGLRALLRFAGRGRQSVKTGMMPAASPANLCKSQSSAIEADALQNDLHNKKCGYG